MKGIFDCLVVQIMITVILTMKGALSFTFKGAKGNEMFSRHTLQMMVSRSPKYAGQTPPTGFFDPLHLSDPISEIEFKRYREAELKHGRIAML